MYDIVVLGAGVVGLSTAVNIQKVCPDRKVTVIADRFLSDTTSDGAAGIFRVTTGLTAPKCPETFRKWCETSFSWYHTLNTQYDPKDTGVIRQTGYQFSDTHEYPYHHQFVYDFKELTKKELDSFPGNQKYGWKFTTLMTECRRYLPWLTKRFLEAGGVIERRTVEDIREFAGRCQILVNCLGLNAAVLFNDTEVFPVRGHLVRVKADWLKHFYVLNNGETYMYTGQDNVILGGTRQKGRFDLTPAYQERWYDDVIARCTKLLPALKNAPIDRKWTGLRPHRTFIRLETETLTLNGSKLKVVHNYGHGANGVALSWGTAVDAANLVKDSLSNTNMVKSKL